MPPAETALLTHQVLSVPRLEGGLPELRGRLLPQLALAHAARRAVACCWIRARPNGRFALLVGGLAADAAVPFPPGAKGAPLRPEQVVRAVNRLSCWRPAELALDCLREETDDPPPVLDDLFALLPDRPAALLVVAEPCPASALETRVSDLSDTVADLEKRRSGRGSERIRLARAEAELTHFDEAAALGAWRLRVWTAGENESVCTALAAMIGGIDGPLRVRPTGPKTDLRWDETCDMATSAVTALLRPPLRELPGIRVTTSPAFDRTPETAGELALGRVLDATDTPSLPFGVALDSVNRHVFVTGATGAGKSQTVRTLLEALSGRGIPWLVVEPAKAEYAAIAGRIAPAEVLVIRPGAPDAVPASLNPLEPSSTLVNGRRVRFPLQTHVDMVRALFTASFDAQEPFPQILARALTSCYTSLGWNLPLGASLTAASGVLPRWPTLTDLERHSLAAVDDIGYGPEVQRNMRGFVGVRIGSLRSGTPGRFFEGGHPLDLDRLLTRNAVFEIEDLGDDNDKAFFIGCVMLRMFEWLRLREKHGLIGSGLAHVTVIEEAHRLLRHVETGTAAAQAVTMFANLFAEVRAYGEGIVVAEQIPAKLLPDVVKNSAVKLVHRLPAKDDRDFVGATMNVDEDQSQHVVSLPPGTAVAHTDGMDRPVLVAIDAAGRTRESRAPAVTTPPVRPRGPACPSQCACPLDRIVRAEHLRDAPWISLWAEVAVLAHLVGESLGALSDPFRSRLRVVKPLVLDCAIAAAADASAKRRGVHVQPWYDPRDLARRVGEVMRDQVGTGASVSVPEPRWRIGQFRWARITRVLGAPPGPGDDPAVPHPRTAAWHAAGFDVPGATWADQLANATASAARDMVPAREALGGEPSIVDDLTSALAGGDSPAERLNRALDVTGLNSAWPAFRLRSLWEA
ncbi:helicase HerA-like domain-containing protein [Lentzea sp. BCCO 10_0798]|uniref:Helicase HerA-like domain-containing protein n=1 Tax=Lentzea kristufekii TaxID=3095430 RepID=A0ABU4TMX6_9PSEU|nr:helicase HerA-like domain-containing protein [Lentzea sp. BCCO 10_0798]MDX8049631.1 helicase HerA-like domain-containing protein [Lentzea sp. BCCO 10_0798]